MYNIYNSQQEIVGDMNYVDNKKICDNTSELLSLSLKLITEIPINPHNLPKNILCKRF